MDANDPALNQLLEQAADEESGLQIAILTIDRIVENAAQTLHNHFLDTRIPSIVSTDTVRDVLDILQERLKTIIAADPDLNPIWIPEAEPIPPPIDVQASGVMRVFQHSVPVGYQEFKAGEPSDGRESTVSSSRRSSSKRSVARNPISKPDDRGSMRQPEPPKLAKIVEPRQIPPEVEERERFRELHMKRLARPNPTTTGMTTVARIETDAETEQLNKILEAAAGRPYTYDSHGGPVVISALKPERLPPFLARTEVVVPPDTPIPEPLPEKKKPKPKREKKNNAAFVKPSTDAQPTIAQSIVMAPGVTIKEGSVVKSGEKALESLSVENMTLAQYRAYLEQESPSLTEKVPDPGVLPSVLPDVGPATPSRPSSPSTRFNELLIKDPNWGTNPDMQNVRPVSIRSVARPPANRMQTRTPRTRPFIEKMIPKKHLSHPIFPRSKGHEGRIPRSTFRNEKSSIEKVRRAARDEVQYPKRIEKRGQPQPKIYTTPLAKRLFSGESMQ